MKRGSRLSWHLAGALLASAVGCNLVLGNEKGHLAPEGEGGGDAEAGMGTFGGKAGSGGKRGGGGAPSAGETGEAGNAAGGSGGTIEPGDGGEPSDGGSTPLRGGAPSSGGKANGGSGGRSSGGTMGQGGSAVPPPMGGAQSCDPDTAQNSCVNTSTVRYCDDTSSTWVTTTCTSACSTLGFTSGTCPDDSGCLCAGPKNPNCYAGAENYCMCAGCSLEELLIIYGVCFEGTAPYDATTLCWAEAPSCDDGILVCGGYDDDGGS